jgi:phosphoribosylanthranilate isomerase
VEVKPGIKDHHLMKHLMEAIDRIG